MQPVANEMQTVVQVCNAVQSVRDGNSTASDGIYNIAKRLLEVRISFAWVHSP